MQARPKTTPSSGSAQRSKTWIRLWPRVAIATWTITMTRNPSQNHESGRPTRASSANEPLTLLTMNQPNAPVTVFKPAGRMFPRNPNAPRLATIIGTPNLGPQDERIACVNDPGPEPRPEEVDRLPVALLEGDVFDPSRLDGGDPLPVVALPNRNVLFDFLHR